MLGITAGDTIRDAAKHHDQHSQLLIEQKADQQKQNRKDRLITNSHKNHIILRFLKKRKNKTEHYTLDNTASTMFTRLVQLSLLFAAVAAEPEFMGGLRGLKSCHDCSCFTCDSVADNGDGTLTVTVGHCKGGNISWMCCTAVDGVEGDCRVDDCPSGDVKDGGKCEGVPSSGMQVVVSSDATSFDINTHDGQTAGNADMNNNICGGNGNQGGGCASGGTAHCLVNFNLANDCGYTPPEEPEQPEEPEEPEQPEDPEEPEQPEDPEEPNNDTPDVCPGNNGVVLVKTGGSTPLSSTAESDLPIKVLSRAGNTATFQVENVLGSSVGHTFTQFEDTDLNEECVDTMDLAPGGRTETFTLECMNTNKDAVVTVFVADSEGAVSGNEEIPRCCKGPNGVPAVRYVFMVHCECPEMEA